MISAGKLQTRCPGCRAQILGFYDALLLPRSIASRPFLRPRATPVSATSIAPGSRARHPSSVRQFSTTKRVFNEVPPSGENAEPRQAEKEPHRSEEATAEEIEILVRQARQTFGNTLPKDYLSAEEYKVYERLYGPPLRETAPEDVGLPLRDEHGEVIDESTPQHALFRETEHGDYEQVQYRINSSVPGGSVEAAETTEPGFPGELAEEATNLEVQDQEDTQPPLSDAHVDYLNITANNQREYHALVKLQRDFEAAAALRPMEEIHEEIHEDEGITEQDYPKEEEEIREDDEYEPGTEFEVDEMRDSREHPFTSMGKFKTSPSTIYLPKMSFVEPISTLLKRTDHTHIKQCGEENLGGPGFPHGPGSPRSKVNVPQKGLGLQASVGWMSEIEADTFLATIMPPVYATAMSTLVEVRKRLGPEWLRGLLARDGGQGPRVLDVGAGGAALAAWQQVLQAEWDILRENGEVSGRYPPGKKTTIVGNEHLRHRVSRFLHNTTFLPRLPDYLHVASEHDLGVGDKPAPRKEYDVIIASHLMMPLDKEYKRKDMLDNLWKMLNPEGGVLILLEKGHPRGFEAVADARDRILDNFIIPPHSEPRAEEVRTASQHVREPGMIIAPCTNHQKCPMYHHAGFSPGRKDFCHFQQRYIRPPFLQQIVGASRRSHEDISFSYIAVRRGAYPEGHASSAGSAADVSSDAGPSTTSDHAPVYVQGKEASNLAFEGYEAEDSKQPHPLSLPRNILPPLKRHGHVTLDLCTPQATIERWVVSKSFSKQAYRDARKAQWGDLWALGAKTRTLRNVRLGRAGQEATVVKDAGVRSRRALESAGRRKDKVVEINVHPQFGVTGAYEKHARGRAPEQRRTKGGKKVKIENLMEEMGANELPDPDDIEDAEYLKSKDY
ncbi:mitochondrial small ribosomal subunit Rsm22-domain-containing protein [Triangularia verruculosa]|uniref:Mitochondrial small ribosomal subunit Rsm22-domain-containing protein n=1 Tax=Triangularia verruculosa TaxID=2587418 RepID=A0AAN6XHS4_9PEZI|nr:mitochondrial small ribosomal subunit Rsm22-domain-containing protein [Triangularia verruculosa]